MFENEKMPLYYENTRSWQFTVRTLLRVFSWLAVRVRYATTSIPVFGSERVKE